MLIISKLTRTTSHHQKNITIIAHWGIWMYDHDGPNQIYGAMKHLDKEIGPFMKVDDFNMTSQTDKHTSLHEQA